MLFRQHSASIHFCLFTFSVRSRCQRRVAVYHIDLEGYGRLVCLSVLPRLLALYHDGLFLNVDNIDRVNGFRLIRDSFNVLRRNNSHGLDDANLLLWFRDASLVICVLLLRWWRSWVSHSGRGLLDDAIAATLRLLIHSTRPRAPICRNLLGLLLLR